MAARGATAGLPIAAICCLGLILLGIAATIVLALIPVYLQRKNVSLAPLNSQQATQTFSIPLSTGQTSGPLSASETAQLSSALQGGLTGGSSANGGATATSASIGGSGRRKRQLGFFCFIVVFFFARTRAFLRRIQALIAAFILAQIAFFNALIASIFRNRSTSATTASATTAAAVVSTTGSSAVITASGRRRRNILLHRQAQQAALEAADTYKD